MRQAVVLMHGIGEQKPMGTVRGFVKAILGAGTPDQPTYWSKPDTMSRSFELRRLSSRGRPTTDFYEYYWASNLEGTKLWDLGRWVLALMRRPWGDLPRGTRSLWVLSWLLLLAALALLASGWGEGWYKKITEVGAISLLASGVLLVVQFVLVNYLGDAARYLSPLPGNIKLRQTIRKEGIELLKTLQESRKYDRIVVVGHSLGSVIAYDAITHLWLEVNESLPGLSDAAVQAEVRKRMAQGHGVQPAVRDELSVRGGALTDTTGLEDFRAAQADAWREQRYFGNPWRITDLITLGSPLTHAMLLMADSKDDFRARKSERELPTCPPQRDQKGYSYGGTTAEVGEGKKFTPLVLHHAAPFAVTRWTNLYFPAALGLFGDIVGGPLREQFGLGIKDIPVTTRLWRGLGRHTIAAHTSYWLPQDGDAPAEDTLRAAALFKLKQELALDHLRDFRARLKESAPQVLQPDGGARQSQAGSALASSGEQRLDPYRHFRYRVKLDGRFVAGANKVSGMRGVAGLGDDRQESVSGVVQKLPGRTQYEPITIERGVTHDEEFEQWASEALNIGAGMRADMALEHLRKDVTIELYNESDQLTVTYKVYRCWVSESQMLRNLDANVNGIAIQSIKLENEGWERDDGIPEPGAEVGD